MGTASFSVSGFGTDRNTPAISTSLETSGAHTTSTTASFIEDASGDISLTRGQVLVIHADEAMRLVFGGDAATASTGHYIPADGQLAYEIQPADEGKVSAIDVA